MNTNPQPDALRSRWTLEGRVPLSGVADGAVWHRARSISTGEGVVLFVVRGEAALEAADAVRRAYLVEDPHLLAVKDIVVFDDPRDTRSDRPAAGSTDGPTTVVEYSLPPAPPLAALLAEGPLHPETARAIIGEAATGLEAARRRGVRHQFLDSNRVFVDTRSGAVVLLGIGVEAAAHPGLDRSREVASFQDTAALVALLYRALTGRSPRHDATGTVPRPSTIVDTAIPEDLDLLCDLVLNESADEIPETTRGLIEALQPWQSIPVTLEAYARSAESPSEAGAPAADGDTAAGTAVAGAAAGAAVAGAAADGESEAESTPSADVPGATGTEPTSTQADGASDDELESTALMAAVPDEESTPGQDPAPDQEPAPDQDTDLSPAAATAAGAVGTAGAAALAASAVGRTGSDEPSTPAEAADAQPTAPDRADDTQHDSAAARALVEDLHLDQKRNTSPFPGQLEITAPPEPATEGDPDTESGAQASGGAVGAAAACTATGAAASWEVAERTPDIPSRTAGSHWPLVGTDAGDAPLAPASVTQGAPEGVPQNRGQASTPASTTPDGSAPTPSNPVAHSEDAAATAPVAVTGRTHPVAPVREDGPIVIHGRDRSVLEEPEESTVPFQRSSLLRDVVGVAVNTDAPETYAMGPRDREKRSLQSQWIIIGGAIVVMIALVIALTTITSDIRDILADPLATSPAATTAAPTEEETEEAPVEPTAEETEEALPAPQIDSVELLALPDGEEPDHTDQQERLTDGDTSTYWSTQHYASPDYGGLMEGVGIRLHFAEPSTFTAVTVATALNNGGAIELRAVNEDGSPGEVLATGEFVADGEVRLEAPEEMETDAVMLWIPELPPDSSEDGRFRARIAEIQVE
ncbi:hypothetical protein CFK38_02865 [Brachybacterium vulturis]|uniref:Serine/threonine protein kinase n=1 Tax=Brachybacterium vulturis TaxID=2017484 RepID=A0A291GK71_9MICO|nr:hypothetical protein [Brachybacterium vulturis]ATG50578.1 hypothetical protein CFK38_02865 [Brachybacterium vulturis]